MPITQIKGKSLLFIHIPKTGGETAEHYLRSVSDNSRQPSFLRRPNPEILPCSPQHLHGGILSYLFQPESFDYGFTVTRDPVARAISEYKFRAGRRYVRGLHVPDFSTWWTKTRKAYQKNPFILDNHIRPQVEFLAPTLSRNFDIFKFEDGVLNNLAKVFKKMNIPFTDLNIHTHKAQNVPIQLDEATFENLVKFYTEDIHRLGYCVKEMQKKHLG